MLKYEIKPRWLRAEIEAVEVVKETTNSVWLKSANPKYEPRRAAKKSEYAEYYDTWEKAHARLCDLSAKGLVFARNALRRAQDIDGNIRGMKQPPPVDGTAQETVTTGTTV